MNLKRITRPAPLIVDLVLLALALYLPYMPFMAEDRSKMSLAVLAGIYVMLGLSLNIIVGYAGLFQLGHAAFFGLGAYTAAILSIEREVPILLTIPIAALVVGVAAILVTKPIIHLRGDYLCIATIAFGEIFRIAVTNNIFGITGGSNGLFGAGRPELPLPWLEPVPFVTLAVVLALHLFLTRKNGLLLQWGGAAIMALAYYGLPRLLDREPLFVISIVMVVVVLIVGAILRDRRVNTLGQFAALVIVVAAFALLIGVEGKTLAAEIEANVDEYFRVQDPVKLAFGLELTPAAFKRDPRPYYFLVLAFIVITVVGMRRLQNSRLGRAWLYVREDQLAAEAMGIDTTKVKLIAFVIGSAWAGVAGVLYAGRFTVVAPESFNFLQSVIMFSIVVLGGSGSIPGVLVGTWGMVVLPELLRDVGPTFLYEGSSPIIILAVLLVIHLYNGQHRLAEAALESAAVAAAFFVPSLLLDQPPLYVIGILMALLAVILIPRFRRRSEQARWWLFGALAVYTAVLLLVGGAVGPDLKRGVDEFRIMDWRDGLMGVAMVTMMVLRPAGIIPERRQGVVISAVTETPDTVPVTAIQQTT